MPRKGAVAPRRGKATVEADRSAAGSPSPLHGEGWLGDSAVVPDAEAYLAEVMRSSITVWQDLNKGGAILDAQTASKDTTTAASAPSERRDATRRDPQRRRIRRLEEGTLSGTTRRKEPASPPIRRAPSAEAMSETCSLGGGERCRPGMGLDPVIAAFARAGVDEEDVPSSIALPSLSEAEVAEGLQPRVLKSYMGCQPHQRSSMTDPSRVYVLSSGYVVQSIQSVLEKAQAAKTGQDRFLLQPFFHPGRSIPVWEASVDVPCQFVEMQGRCEMLRIPPRTTRFPTEQCMTGINVQSLLASMDEDSKHGEFLPQPMPADPQPPLSTDIREFPLRSRLQLGGETQIEQNLQEFARKLADFGKT